MTVFINGLIATTLLIGGAMGVSAYAHDNNQKVNTLESKQFSGMKKAEVVALKQAPEKVDAYNANVLNVKESHEVDKVVTQTTPTKSLISEEQAIAIAKENSDGEVTELELDSDDGQYEYEVDIQTSKGEYEITIDAITGKVLVLELDSDSDND